MPAWISASEYPWLFRYGMYSGFERCRGSMLGIAIMRSFRAASILFSPTSITGTISCVPGICLYLVPTGTGSLVLKPPVRPLARSLFSIAACKKVFSLFIAFLASDELKLFKLCLCIDALNSASSSGVACIKRFENLGTALPAIMRSFRAASSSRVLYGGHPRLRRLDAAHTSRAWTPARGSRHHHVRGYRS